MGYGKGERVWVPIEQQPGTVRAVAQGWCRVLLDDGRVRALLLANLQPLPDQRQTGTGPGAGEG